MATVPPIIIFYKEISIIDLSILVYLDFFNGASDTHNQVFSETRNSQ